MRLAAAVAIVAALLAGCVGGTDCPFVVGGGVTALPIATYAEPYTGRVAPGVLGQVCSPTLPTVRGSVLDETNTVVPSQWEIDPTTGSVALVRFTPMGEGPFRLVAEFSPSIARVEGQVFVARKRQRPVLAEYALPSPDPDGCLHLFPSGALNCRNTAGLTYLVINGAVVQTFSQATVRFAGPVMWASRSGRLERWVEGDGGLVLTQQAFWPGELTAATESIAFTVGVADGDVTKVTLDGGSFDLEPFPFTVFGSSGKGSITADAGAWWSTGDQLCLNPLVADGGRQCFDRTHSLTTAEPNGVWSTDGHDISLRTEDGMVRSLADTGGTPVPPFLQYALEMLVLVPYEDRIRIERFEGSYDWGDLDGDRLLLHSPQKITVVGR